MPAFSSVIQKFLGRSKGQALAIFFFSMPGRAFSNWVRTSASLVTPTQLT